MTMPPETITLPPGIDRATFIRDYWQKKPLLMRGAMSPTAFTLSPDELAGLACEDEIEARLLIQGAAGAWQVRHGPFDDNDFAALPEHDWTLLVQDVDKYVPAVGQLIDAFDFVPGWRIDDIMISFAADGGGVGPHTDAYDVFLMQAHGRRRWRLSYESYTDNDLLPGLEQRILARFRVDEDWLLQPGDVLYLPPGIAHWGTAEGDCMTYSLGFRSPSQQELAADWFQYRVGLACERRLADPGDLSVESPGEITAGAVAAARQLLDALPGTDSAEFSSWLGRHFTEPKPQFQVLPPDDDWDRQRLAGHLAARRPLQRHPYARISWMRTGNDAVTLFWQGQATGLPPSCQDLAALLAQHRRLPADTLVQTLVDDDGEALLLQLLNDGILEEAEE